MQKRNLFDYFSTPKRQQNGIGEPESTLIGSSQDTDECSVVNQSLLSEDKSCFYVSEEKTKAEKGNKLEMVSGKIIDSHNANLEKEARNLAEFSDKQKKSTEVLAEKGDVLFEDNVIKARMVNGMGNKTSTEERYTFLVDIRDKNKVPKGDPGYDPSTLYISEADYKKFTPFERQFWDIKKNYFDTIVFFKKGMFYELYEDDATLSAQLFDFQVTERVNMRMSGFPESNYDYWAARFLEKGHKIARVEQSENMIGKMIREQSSKQVKAKIIERELKEVVTQGTIYHDEHLKSHLPVYLLALENLEDSYFLILFDASVNKLYFISFIDDKNLSQMKTVFAQYDIREIVSSEELLRRLKFSTASKVSSTIDTDLIDEAKKHFEQKILKHLGNVFSSEANNMFMKAKTEANAEGLHLGKLRMESNEEENMDYVFDDKFCERNAFYRCYLKLFCYMSKLKRLGSFVHASPDFLSAKNRNMHLDNITIDNLELLKNSYDGSDNKTLFKVINNCVSPFGMRLLKKWMLSPLMDKHRIAERHAKSGLFYELPCVESLQNALKLVGDLERYFGRLQSSNPTTKDLLTFMRSIQQSLEFLRMIRDTFGKEIVVDSENLSNNGSEDSCASGGTRDESDSYTFTCVTLINKFEDILFVIGKSYTLTDTGIVINESMDEELSNLICNMKMLEKEMHAYLDKIKKQLNCEARYIHKGKEIFQIEVSVAVKLPSKYAIISKTKTHNRFYTSDLLTFVKQHKEMNELIFQCKGSMLKRVVGNLLNYNVAIYGGTSYMATLDCYMSFAKFARLRKTSIPIIIEERDFDNVYYRVEGLSNPVYPHYISSDYVSKHKVLVLTGPNMGGKSTFLRSICLNIILCQMGMQVCCSKFVAPIFDRIFTRIGASDNLLRGESTFMIELSETSKILKYCTNKSFIIIDELGRGTSARDGEVIAKSVLSYLKSREAYVVFSTHYHNLVKECGNVSKGFMDALVSNDDIVFLYKVKYGICEKSHALYVARLAGVPNRIIEKAKSIRADLTR